MGRVFGGTNEYLYVKQVCLTAVPATTSCWFKSSSTTTNQWLVSLTSNSTAFDNIIGIRLSGAVAGDPVTAVVTQNNTSALANTSSAYSASTWGHATGVFSSSTSRTAYLNGSGSGSETSSSVPASIAETGIGVFYSDGNNNYASTRMNGTLSEAAIYSSALAMQDVSALSLGFSPVLVRPPLLEAYYPMGGAFGLNDRDVVRQRDLSSAGSPTWGEHPKTIYPCACMAC